MIIQNNNPYTEPSFSINNRLMRGLWGIVYLLFFRISPRPVHKWRAFILRVFGAKLGQHVHIYPSVKIWAPWNLIIGNYVGIGNDAILYCMDTITIGDYAVISQGAHLCCGTHNYNSKNFQLLAKPIIIESQTWVCAEAFIHPGVVIAEGCVIGARSVVTKNLLEPWSVYAGNPCRQVAIRHQ